MSELFPKQVKFLFWKQLFGIKPATSHHSNRRWPIPWCIVSEGKGSYLTWSIKCISWEHVLNEKQWFHSHHHQTQQFGTISKQWLCWKFWLTNHFVHIHPLHLPLFILNSLIRLFTSWLGYYFTNAVSTSPQIPRLCYIRENNNIT